MAGMAKKIVAQFMETKGIKLRDVSETILCCSTGFEGGSADVFMDFNADDAHVHFRGMNFIKVPKDKCDVMLKAVNECNDKFSHIKFVLDMENGQITAQDDDIIQLDSCGIECYELLFRTVGVIEAAYPIFMKALWS